MADSWDDDEFEPESLAATPPPPSNWDDEEEEEEEEEVSKVGMKPTLSEATRKRLEQKKAAEKEAKLAELLDAEETEGDRIRRERRMVEEGDNALTNELFGAEQQEDKQMFKLKDLKDHLSLAQTLQEQLADSKKNHVAAFFKEMLRSQDFEEKDLGDMIAILQAQKDAKVKAAKKPTLPTKKKKATKKEIQDMKKKANDIFGSTDNGGEYDHYEDEFDDFF